MAQQISDSISADTVSADSTALDTSHHDTTYVMIIEPEKGEPLPERAAPPAPAGLSWISAALLLLFVVVAIRFRNNSKYLGALLRSAIEVRTRGNVFDDTVKESSFMLVLNIMWCLCTGVLLYTLTGGRPEMAGSAAGMGMGVLLCAAYELFMILAYWIVGNVFSDSLHTKLWVRGFLSATGLTTLVLFPAALLTLCYPALAVTALWIGLFAIITGKIVFIWKGFRIFFTQMGAWVLFLYYLCSLEIVPLILLYVAALNLC